MLFAVIVSIVAIVHAEVRYFSASTIEAGMIKGHRLKVFRELPLDARMAESNRKKQQR